MKNIALILVLFTCIGSTAKAHTDQDSKTETFINAFTRNVTQHSQYQEEHQLCLHTLNLAQQHLRLWQQWNKTRRWPLIATGIPPFSNQNYPPKPNATSVVRVSLYLNNETTNEIEVDNSGRVATYGARYDMGPYESSVFYLKPARMNVLQVLLRKLPSSRKVTTLSDVLLISGRRNQQWFLRMYSRSHQPETVRQILQIITHNPKTIRANSHHR